VFRRLAAAGEEIGEGGDDLGLDVFAEVAEG
jgi:hypothetical protein